MIRIIEVGPRDGLQNERMPIPTAAKSAFIRALAGTGLKEIEATSFVSPKWVRQLADAEELWGMLRDWGDWTGGTRCGGAKGRSDTDASDTDHESRTTSRGMSDPRPLPLLSALVPNLRGLERALAAGVKRIALFTAANDAFTQKNILMSVEESLSVFEDVAARFRTAVPGGWIRGYVSTAFECPYAGPIAPERAAEVARRLLELGVDEVSIGDTVGAAVPADVKLLTPMLLDLSPADRFAYHFHDTRGTAIANVAAALDCGIASFDSSAGGLGGCPYAPGAGGNLATEDLVYFLERSGFRTGVSMAALARASLPVLELLGRAPGAKAQRAALAESLPMR
jgi:hydroxymethylglutaryl-CoA lyase